MTSKPNDLAAAPLSSGFMLGVRLTLPVLPGIIAFALAVGAVAVRKDFSLFDHVAMNLLVYAGMSQLVAMEGWPNVIDVSSLLGLAALSATVNARLMLMSASLQPWLAELPRWKLYPMLHLVTDPGWLISMRYRAEGGSDIGVFIGSGAAIFVVWFVGTLAGYGLGTLIADPSKYGIDLVMPIFFAAMLVPLWRGVRRGAAWLVAGAVALSVQQLAGGWWFIVAGAIAGAVAGGFLDDAE
jgi:predicted branched-subunit amino acid permease